MNQSITADIHAVTREVMASGLVDTFCTVQQPSGNFNAAGAPDGVYVDLAGHVNIPCRLAPPSEARVQATEVKAMAEITAKSLGHVFLGAFPGQTAGYYPLILAGYRAVIEGVNYEILGAEDDGNQQHTRLAVQLASI